MLSDWGRVFLGVCWKDWGGSRFWGYSKEFGLLKPFLQGDGGLFV